MNRLRRIPEPLQMLSCTPPAASSVSVWPVALPENRVEGSAAFSFVFTFQFIGETIDIPSENGGCGYDFASGVHKYLYAGDDPVNKKDPTGHDWDTFFNDQFCIKFAMSWQNGVPSVDQTGSSGPDVTTILQDTMQNVRQTFTQDLANNQSLKQVLYAETPWGMENGWDIDPLYEMGYDALLSSEYPTLFGSGCSEGTGIGHQTVQLTINGKTCVYYGGSVNYVLWGEMFSLLESIRRDPLPSDEHVEPDFNENFAVTTAWAYKTIGRRDFGLTKSEADAFVRFGYSGADPSSTALQTIAPIPWNAPTSLPPLGRMKWKWIGIPGHEQAE